MNMSIKNEEDFYIVVQNCIAPIYFFGQENTPNKGEKITQHGTLTLFRNKHKIYGVTNHHVYKRYEKEKNANENTVCQIGVGNQCKIILEDKIAHVDIGNDLIIFHLNDEDLKKMSTAECQKTGFTVLDDRIDEYLHSQDPKNCETWPLHAAGYPTTFHVIDQISNTKHNSDFGIFLSYGYATSNVEKISLNIRRARENTEIIAPDLPFPEEKINFGGISGGPVFLRTASKPCVLSLVGIIYEGISLDISCESINAKPISLIKDILISC